jgi:hypothetical protein
MPDSTAPQRMLESLTSGFHTVCRVYNTIELAGMSNRVKNARYCPVGSGCEVRWMSLSA